MGRSSWTTTGAIPRVNYWEYEDVMVESQWKEGF